MVSLFVSNWDTNQKGASWDSGLQWDVTVGTATGDITKYLGIITSEHNQLPKFMAMVENNVQPYADNVANAGSLFARFDVDFAVGDQLDIVGKWIGPGRNIATPLTGVYFSFDDPALGFDLGTWFNAFNPVSGVFRLSDEAYRTLLRARVSNNQWDGTIPGAYAVWDSAFFGTGIGILIQDLGTMHIVYAMTGPIPDAITLALFTGGYLNLKPAGVHVDSYYTPTASGAPYFGFDAENSGISGFDVGAWGKPS